MDEKCFCHLNGVRVKDAKKAGILVSKDTKAEIFNDIENNVAVGECTHAEGKETRAIKKAFEILEITINGDGSGYFTVSQDVSEFANRMIGQQYSCHLTQDFNGVGTITSVNGQLIYVDKLPTDTTTSTYPHTSIYGNFLWVPSDPGVGTSDVLNMCAHAEGWESLASGVGAHAEGNKTKAQGNSAHAEGGSTIASAAGAHAEGNVTVASGACSHAEGQKTTASGGCAHAEGYNTKAQETSTHAEGAFTVASGAGAHAEGCETKANGNYSHAEGSQTIADGTQSHAEGYDTKAQGGSAHAEGGSTIASGSVAHAEGYVTVASGNCSHAEGCETIAEGNQSHAEGYGTKAQGNSAHAEGGSTIASGAGAHAEGDSTVASGDCSHAEGQITTASHIASHAGGRGTKTASDYQTVVGTFNEEDSTASFIVGNGGDETTRQNAFVVKKTGWAEIKEQGTTGKSVVQKQYVDLKTQKTDRTDQYVINSGKSSDGTLHWRLWNDGFYEEFGISETTVTWEQDQMSNNYWFKRKYKNIWLGNGTSDDFNIDHIVYAVMTAKPMSGTCINITCKELTNEYQPQSGYYFFPMDFTTVNMYDATNIKYYYEFKVQLRGIPDYLLPDSMK